MSIVIGAGVRAVFFDAVGTLLFPAEPPAETYAAAARRQGVHVDSQTVLTRFVTAFRAEEEFDRAAGWVTNEPRERERWRCIVAASLPELPDPDRGFAELFAHFARPDAWTVHPDTPTVLAELTRRGLAVGVGSNLDARLLEVVAGHPTLAPVADRVVVSAAVGYRKPSQRFFDEVVRAAGREPWTIGFVGDDAENDHAGATAAGLIGVHLCADGTPALVPHVRRLLDLLG